MIGMGSHKDKVEKTNAMRLLDGLGIAYGHHVYDPDEALSGVEEIGRAHV